MTLYVIIERIIQIATFNIFVGIDYNPLFPFHFFHYIGVASANIIVKL